jgi:hypothetical protein
MRNASTLAVGPDLVPYIKMTKIGLVLKRNNIAFTSCIFSYCLPNLWGRSLYPLGLCNNSPAECTNPENGWRLSASRDSAVVTLHNHLKGGQKADTYSRRVGSLSGHYFEVLFIEALR